MARASAWLRCHPTGADTLLALLILVTALLPLLGESDSNRFPVRLTGFTVVALLVGCACLVVRRRYPWSVLVATTVVGLVAVVEAGGPTPAYLPACVALYTVATVSSTGRTVAAALVSSIAPGVLLLANGWSGAVNAFAFGMSAWSGLAAMSGIAVRKQRAVVAAAQERARQAEVTREEEAQRRVAEERLRIARELHDVVAHHVSVINVQAGVAGHLLRADPDGAAEAIAHVREASRTVLAEVPALLGLLRTGEDALQTAPAPGLADAEALVEQARRSGLRVTRQSTGAQQQLPPLVDLTAYRVVQEALTNASRHGCGHALLTMTYAADGCTIEVRNQRAQHDSRDPTPRHGLVGMAERVAAVGGELDTGGDGDEWVVRARFHASPR